MIGARKSTHSAAIALGSVLHADTINWQSRVVAAGGSISNSILTATDTLIKWAYANGLRDNTNANHLIRFWLPLCTDTFSGLFIPIWHPVSNTDCTNNNFVSGDYSRLTGLQGQSVSTKYIKSAVTTTHLGASSTSIYFAADSSTDTAEESTAIGCVADGSATPAWISALWPKYIDNNCYIEHPGNNGAAGNVSSSIGFFYGLRNGNTTAIYRDSTLINTATSTPSETIPSGIEYYLFADRSVATGVEHITVSRRYQGFLIGAGGITQAQATSFATQYLTWKAIARA